MSHAAVAKLSAERPREVSVAGIGILAEKNDEFLDRVADWARVRRSAYVCFVGAHGIVLAGEDADMASALKGADLRTADGTPVAWCARRLSRSRVEILDGPMMMPLVIAMAAERGLAVGFLGANSEVLSRLVKLAKERHPGIRIPFALSPPFRELSPQEDAGLVRDINSAGVQLLFVGLGCPKQEKWMAAHRNRVHAVMLGVGAAFDFYAGVKHMPPRWFQCLGLTWLFRLLQEPKRLWRRDVNCIPRFLAIAAHDVLRRKSQNAS